MNVVKLESSQLASAAALTDEELVRRILAGEHHLFELVMRRHNQRLFRAARSITKSETEAEDVMQDAYVRAYEHLSQFEGRARFYAWLRRIRLQKALARKRQDAPAPPGDWGEAES